jgi:glycosyltransferase involved in cell wall biosynthesis
MKVAHVAIITPRLCGLYETTREIVVALRAIGIDSRLVDPLPDDNPLKDKVPKGEDRGAPIADLAWIEEVDIIVSHSGIKTAMAFGKPIIQVAHGRPRHSFLSEREGSGAAIYSHWFEVNRMDQYKALVTLWPEHKPYLDMMLPDKPVHSVQSTVDLDFWKPGAPNYDFGGKAGGVNIVCTDAFRSDIDCYDAVNAYALWARDNQHLNPKLHVYGFNVKNKKGWSPLFLRIKEDGNLGQLCGWVQGLERVYRSADLLLTGHTINVRSVRESMACGCPVVRVKAIRKAKISKGLKMNRLKVRKRAEHLFNPAVTAKQFERILEGI